ncbi:MAG: hypothetical protein SGILL_001029 [Bacillariaceae sp.]
MEILVRHNVSKIFLVMDGKRCPLKADESQDRERKRRQNLEEARRYKVQGKRHLAEEKYKGCIRIREDFTNEVMKTFRKQLFGETRIDLMWSPYEADAQLVKLCIDDDADAIVTEDSDVLVYSAAAHVAFPVLFKLDRSTGSCQMISMEFLLSATPENSDKAMKSTSKLEEMIRRLASRQEKRKGFGVRLFVQACVLGGCDYTINNLDGIGLVGAFKLVRDNAFRNDNVRFQKILQSLPNKVKKKLNIDEYEERLAKSEAVFFYHLVEHSGGVVKPLLPPRISSEDNPHDHHHTNHFPFMKRFEEWSFLGQEASLSSCFDLKDHERLCVTEASIAPIPIPEQVSSTNSQFFVKQASSLSSQIYNPYKKAKRKPDATRTPLEERDANENSLPQSSLTEDLRGQARKDLDVLKYLKEMPDPRYVKRKFPSKRKTPMPSSISALNVPIHQANTLTASRPQLRDDTEARHLNSNMFSRFECVDTVDSKSPQTSRTASRMGATFHESHAETTSLLRGRKQDQQPLSSNVSPTKACRNVGTGSLIDLTDEDIGETIVRENLAEAIELEQESYTSKYFKTENNPRRVTLEAVGKSAKQKIAISSVQHVDRFSGSPQKHWGSDDAVESPAQLRSGPTPYEMTAPKCGAVTKGSMRPRTSKTKKPSPLLAGFQRQQEFFGHLRSNKQSISRSFSSNCSASKEMKALTEYFQPQKDSDAEIKRPSFNQLDLNTNQSDDDFLWQG